MKRSLLVPLTAMALLGACTTDDPTQPEPEPDPEPEPEPDPDTDVAGIVGRWHISRTEPPSTTCPLDVPVEYDIEIQATATGYQVLRDGDVVDAVGLDPTDPLRFTFEVFEHWGDIDGIPIAAEVQHELERDRDLLHGDARTSVVIDTPGGVECGRRWVVEAGQIPCDSCGGGAAPAQAEVQEMAIDRVPSAVVAGGDRVYWADHAGGLFRIEEDGTSIQIFSSETGIHDLTATATGVVFWDWNQASEYFLHRVGADGTVTDIGYDRTDIESLAADDDTIFVSTSVRLEAVASDGAVTPLLTAEPSLGTTWIRLIDGTLWIGDSRIGAIGTLSDDGASLRRVIEGSGYAEDFDLAEGFMLRSRDGNIERRPIDGGPATFLAFAETDLDNFAVVGGDVYWAASFHGERILRRVSLQGGAAETVYRAASIASLEAHGDTLTWAEPADARIVSFTP
jgi:hypothetical protein